MINITNNIKRAIYKDISWTHSDFYYLIEILENNNFDIDFSAEDDEKLATVTSDNIIIAYIWKKSPLVFLREDYLRSVEILLEKDLSYIEIIAIDDLNADKLSLDLDNNLLDRITCFFDPSGFSANDFWFCNLI